MRRDPDGSIWLTDQEWKIWVIEHRRDQICPPDKERAWWARVRQEQERKRSRPTR